MFQYSFSFNTSIYFDGNKKTYYVKRFLVENTISKLIFITEHKESVLEIISTDWRPQVELIFIKEKGKDRKTEIINLEEFISIKGEKALGNRLTSKKVKQINLLKPLPFTEEILAEEDSDIVITATEIKTEIELNITNDIPLIDEQSDEDNSEGQITLEL